MFANSLHIFLNMHKIITIKIIGFANIFLLQRLIFHFVDSFFSVKKFSNWYFWFIFAFVVLAFGSKSKKSIAKTSVKRSLSYVFF